MNDVVVECGNGGDFEYERDRYYWQKFIENHFPHNIIYKQDFIITPHTKGDLAIVRFIDPHDATIFRLIKPEWISYTLAIPS